jgi:hypothetical protein
MAAVAGGRCCWWSKTGVQAQREFRQGDGLHAPNHTTLASARTSTAVGRGLLTASLQLATPVTLLGLAIGFRSLLSPGTPIATHHGQAPCGTPLLYFLLRMRRRPEDYRQRADTAALRQASYCHTSRLHAGERCSWRLQWCDASTCNLHSRSRSSKRD